MISFYFRRIFYLFSYELDYNSNFYLPEFQLSKILYQSNNISTIYTGPTQFMDHIVYIHECLVGFEAQLQPCTEPPIVAGT